MNLQSWIKKMTETAESVAVAVGFVRQTRRRRLLYSNLMIPMSARIQILTACVGGLLFCSLAASAQTAAYVTNGAEYSVIGSLPGDQVRPDVAISSTGGFAVWQDNATDGDGWGISARRLDSTLSGTLSTFRVNVTGAGNQENPRVAMLKSGGAVFVWQGGALGNQHIYARFLTPNNTFRTTNDVLVSSLAGIFQADPAVAVLNNSNVVVVWGSYDQLNSNSMQDVYGQIFSANGDKVGSSFLINQFTSYNQRNPSVAPLADGGFLVAWVSEQQRKAAAAVGTNATSISSASALTPSVDIYARRFTADGTASGVEFLVNTDMNPCSRPAVAGAADGSFLVAWTARDMANSDDSLDIRSRVFDSAGVGGSVLYANSHLYGDQYVPQVSSIGNDYLLIWTSLGQDGSREGAFGQFVRSDGSLTGNEFRVNTTTIGQQMQPAIASDKVSQFLVVWTSFGGYPNTFDLSAQRFINADGILPPMSQPFVWAPFVVSNNVYQPELLVTWAPVQGLSVSNYEVYVDGESIPMGVVSTNEWIMTAANGLATNSTHSFKLDYVMADGRRSPLSTSTNGTTWSGLNWGGIPYEWMANYFGGYFNGSYHTNYWMPSDNVLASGGPTLYQVFLSGGDPYDPSKWLKTSLSQTSQGLYLSWNTQAGAMYQVQTTTNFQTWSDVGGPRFAAGETDSIYVGGSSVGYYRVILLR